MADEATTETVETPTHLDNYAKTVATEAAAIVETTEGAESSENEAEKVETDGEQGELTEEKPRGKKNVQARIDELTRRAHEAERQADYYRGLATQKAPNSADAAPTEPNPADFEDYGAFVKALAKYEIAQERQAGNSQQAESHAKQADTFRAEAWSSKVEATRATITDYDAVVGSSEIPIAGHVADALMDADRGPELAYHMATHPDVAERLNKMSPVKAAIELGRLESTLGTVTPKPASKAPAPITPTRPGPSAKVDLSKLPMDEYIAERRKQGATY